MSDLVKASSTLGEFLHIAGSVAANHQSPVHRAHALRDIGLLGNSWTENLSTEKSSLAEAITASVRALVAATSAEARTAIASAIRELVFAARAIPAPSPTRCQEKAEPRLYWLERD
jgi:hypothetical protein